MRVSVSLILNDPATAEVALNQLILPSIWISFWKSVKPCGNTTDIDLITSSVKFFGNTWI